MVNVGGVNGHTLQNHRHKLGVVINGKKVPAIGAINNQNQNFLNNDNFKTNNHIAISQIQSTG